MKYVLGFLILVVASPVRSQVNDRMDSVFANHFDSAVMKNPNRDFRARTFAGYLYGEKDKRKVRYYYDLLKNDYTDVPSIKRQLIEFSPDAAIQVGKQIPSFEISLLGGAGKVSDKSMLGKYYLLHFWASWFQCSVSEIPTMHNAYEKYKGKKGFQIISLSFDKSESTIAPFYEEGSKLAEEWKMPWLHAFIPGVYKSNGDFKSDEPFYDTDLGKKFEVFGPKRHILVGPDGKILAIDPDLDLWQLEETLGKYLLDDKQEEVTLDLEESKF